MGGCRDRQDDRNPSHHKHQTSSFLRKLHKIQEITVHLIMYICWGELASSREGESEKFGLNSTGLIFIQAQNFYA